MELRIRGFLLIPRLPTYLVLSVFLPINVKGYTIGREVVVTVAKYFRNKFNHINSQVHSRLRQYFPRFRIQGIKTWIYLVNPERLNIVNLVEHDAKQRYRIFTREIVRFFEDGEIPDHLRKWLRNMNIDVDRYVKELNMYREAVLSYLKSKGINIEDFSNYIPDLSRYVKFMYIPFTLSPSDVEELVTQDVRDAVNRFRKEITELAIKDIMRTIEDGLKEVTKLMEKEVHNVKVALHLAKLLKTASEKLKSIIPELADKLEHLRRQALIKTDETVKELRKVLEQLNLATSKIV